MAVVVIGLRSEQGVRTRVELRQAAGYPSVRVTFEAADTARAGAACLRVLAAVLDAEADRRASGGFPLNVPSLGRRCGRTWLELAGPGACLALVPAFGAGYAEAVPVTPEKKGPSPMDRVQQLREAHDRLKHGPQGSGVRGLCEPDCQKCKLEREIEALSYQKSFGRSAMGAAG